jgi:hypothetical protein
MVLAHQHEKTETSINACGKEKLFLNVHQKFSAIHKINIKNFFLGKGQNIENQNVKSLKEKVKSLKI